MWKVAANSITLVAGIPGLPEVRNKGFVRNYAPPQKNKQTKPVNQRANDTKFPVRADINPGLWESSEKAMAPHSSTLAWNIPWTEEHGRLQSMGSQRVRHDWAISLSRFTFMHWKRKWQPTPVFLPGESQGRGSLVACRLWGRTESDTTEVT